MTRATKVYLGQKEMLVRPVHLVRMVNAVPLARKACKAQKGSKVREVTTGWD